MIDTKFFSTASLFGWIPCVAVAWEFKVFADGDAKTFWYALAGLVAARAFFAIIETLGSSLAWRVFERPRMVRAGVAELRKSGLPDRANRDEPFSSYLKRIAEEP